MANITGSVFSEFEVHQMNVIFPDGNYGEIKCIGKFEEELETKTTTKLCRGVKAKETVKGTGAGTGKVTAHIPMAIYDKLLNMDVADVKSGVKAYGKNSVHPKVCVTCEVYDEDMNVKYKAYPVTVITTGPKREVENGADEVAECEIELGFSPDNYEFGIYEARADEISSTIKNSWMTAFSGALVAQTKMSVSDTVKQIVKGGNATVTVANAQGTPKIWIKQVGSGVSATLSSGTLTISTTSSANLGNAFVELVDDAGATATIRLDIVASA